MSRPLSTATLSTVYKARYDHTQWRHIFWLILISVLILSATMPYQGLDSSETLLFSLGIVPLACIAFSFQSLRVADEMHSLALRWGPIPLIRKRFTFSDFKAAEKDRTTLIDGWGIHWIPGRGWTSNIWGLGCVRLTLAGNRIARIGTDDPDGLEEFLLLRIRQS